MTCPAKSHKVRCELPEGHSGPHIARLNVDAVGDYTYRWGYGAEIMTIPAPIGEPLREYIEKMDEIKAQMFLPGPLLKKDEQAPASSPLDTAPQSPSPKRSDGSSPSK